MRWPITVHVFKMPNLRNKRYMHGWPKNQRASYFFQNVYSDIENFCWVHWILGPTRKEIQSPPVTNQKFGNMETSQILKTGCFGHLLLVFFLLSLLFFPSTKTKNQRIPSSLAPLKEDSKQIVIRFRHFKTCTQLPRKKMRNSRRFLVAKMSTQTT